MKKLVGILFVISILGFAHPGRTDSNGCHTNRKTGQYHCHGKKSSKNSSSKKSSETTKKKSSGKLFFSNCSEARSAGYTNIREGQPGYADHLDRDKDGIACERN